MVEDSSMTSSSDSPSDYSELPSPLPVLEEEDDVSSYEMTPSLQTEDETPEDSLPDLIIEVDEKYPHDESEEVYDDLHKKIMKIFKKYVLKTEDVASPIDSDIVQMYETKFNSGDEGSIVESIQNEVNETASNSFIETPGELLIESIMADWSSECSLETNDLPKSVSQETVNDLNGDSSEEEQDEWNKNNASPEQEDRIMLDRDTEINDDDDTDDHDNAAGEGEESNNNGSSENEIQSDDIEDNNSRSIENEVEKTVSNSFIKTPGELLIESIMADWTSQCSLETNNLPKSASQETVNDLNGDSNEEEQDEWNKNNASPEQEDRIMLDRDTEINDDDDTDDHDNAAGEGEESNNNGSSENEIQSDGIEDNNSRSIENEVEKTVSNSFIKTPGELLIESIMADWTSQCSLETNNLPKSASQETVNDLNGDSNEEEQDEWNKNNASPEQEDRIMLDRDTEINDDDDTDDHDDVAGEGGESINNGSSENEIQSNDNESNVIRSFEDEVEKIITPDEQENDNDDTEAEEQEEGTEECYYDGDDEDGDRRPYVLAKIPDLSPIPEVAEDGSRASSPDGQERATITSRWGRGRASRSYSRVDKRVGEVGVEVSTVGSAQDEGQASVSLAKTTDASKEVDASESADTQTPEIMRHQRRSRLTDIIPAKRARRDHSADVTPASPVLRRARVEQIEPHNLSGAEDPREVQRDVSHHGARHPDWSPIFEIRKSVSRRTSSELQERATISSRKSRKKESSSHVSAGVGEVGGEEVGPRGSTQDEERASARLATPTDASEEGDASLSMDTRTPETMRQGRHSSLTDVTPAKRARSEDMPITSPSRESRTLRVEQIPDASTEADPLVENREDATHMPSPNVVGDIATCYPIVGKIRIRIEKPIRIRFTPSGESSNISHETPHSPIPELNIEVEEPETYTDDESEEYYERLGRRMLKVYRKYVLEEDVDSDDSAVQMYKDCISSLLI